MDNKKIAISLGGSLIFTKEGIDIKFLKKFRQFIAKQIKGGRKFIIVVGGGELARNFQNQAKKVSEIKKDDLDWLGIYPTRCNARLIKTVLGDLCEEDIIINPAKKNQMEKKNIGRRRLETRLVH